MNILRRYRLLQHTQHCPVRLCLRWSAALAALVLASLLAYEWHQAREDALADAEHEVKLAWQEMAVANVVLEEQKEIIDLRVTPKWKLNWKGERL